MPKQVSMFSGCLEEISHDMHIPTYLSQVELLQEVPSYIR